MNHQRRPQVLVPIVLVLLSACARNFSGYGFQISLNPNQQSVRFECRTATSTRQCNVAILAASGGIPTNHVVPVGQSKNLANAPLGAQYCVSEQAISWPDCTKYVIPNGTTAVESGRSER